ncbi:MFS transporter [Chelatococcus reniformis]|nr:MFS transporter [Chelatococcus reniformis]
MFASLMLARRFAPLFWCQFFSAFNDNFVKNILVILVLFKLGGAQAGTLVTLANAFLVVPFFLFSGVAGELADRFDKAFVARRVKAVEIAVAAVAAAGLYVHSLPVMYAALFGLGVIAALFGPIKYGILPDHLRPQELPAANALIEGATFLAILGGTIAGGLAIGSSDEGTVALAMVAIALLCWISSLLIPHTGEAAPTLAVQRNILRSTTALMRVLSQERRLLRAALGVSWFWLTGAVTLSLAPTLVKQNVGGSEDVVTLVLALFSIGIGIGSAGAAMLARGRIILWPVPLAAALIAGFALDLGLAAGGLGPPSHAVGVPELLGQFWGVRLAVDFVGLAVAAGLFVVPLFAALQAWSPGAQRARVVAGTNVLNALFMTVAALLTAALQAAGVQAPALIALLGLLNAAVAGLIFFAFPGLKRVRMPSDHASSS